MYRGGEVAKIELFLDAIHAQINGGERDVLTSNKETIYVLVRLFLKLRSFKDVRNFVFGLLGDMREEKYNTYVQGIGNEIFANSKISNINSELQKIVLDACNFIKCMCRLIKLQGDTLKFDSLQTLFNQIEKHHSQIKRPVDPFCCVETEEVRNELLKVDWGCVNHNVRDELVECEMYLYDNLHLPNTEEKLAVKIF